MKTEAFVLPNGNLVFLADGKPIPEVQKDAWLQLLIEHIEKCGYDHAECTIHLPDFYTAHPFRTSDGKWSWEIRWEFKQLLRP